MVTLVDVGHGTALDFKAQHGGQGSSPPYWEAMGSGGTLALV